MAYQFKVIPFVGKIKSSQGAGEVAQQLQQAIQAEVNSGWEFHEATSVNIEVSPGCIAGLLGAKADYQRYDMLVFKKA